MNLKYKCPECGTPLGFEGLCWRCRAKKHRDEVDNWTDKELSLIHISEPTRPY